MAILWELIDKAKYRHRIQFYGQFDAAVNLIPRKADNYQTVFQLKTLLTSCAKPFSKARNGERLSRAGKEYFHHAAKLQLRFLEVLSLTKHELHSVLHQKRPVDPPSLLTTLTNWFTTDVRPQP